MKRVLFVTPYYAPNIVGGAEISTQLIAEGFPDNAEILTMSESVDPYWLNGVKINCFFDPKLSVIWRKVLENKSLSTKDKLRVNLTAMLPLKPLVAKYSDFIKTHEIDIVVMNSNVEVMGRASIWCACKISHVKSVLVLRDPILLQKRLMGIRLDALYRNIIKRQLKQITTFAAPSRYMIDLYAKYGLENTDSTVLPNAVQTEFISSEVDKKDCRILFAGSIRKEKGILTLLGAVAKLYQENEALTLCVCGRGDLESECKKYPFVQLLPWMKREKLYQEMERAKVVVLPSEWPEAFGRILIEGVAQGTLAVGSDAGGIPEIFSGDQRYIFQSGSEDELCQKLKRILALPDRDYVDEVRALQKNFQKYSYTAYLERWYHFLWNE